MFVVRSQDDKSHFRNHRECVLLNEQIISNVFYLRNFQKNANQSLNT